MIDVEWVRSDLANSSVECSSRLREAVGLQSTRSALQLTLTHDRVFFAAHGALPVDDGTASKVTNPVRKRPQPD